MMRILVLFLLILCGTDGATWAQQPVAGAAGYELRDQSRSLIFRAPNANWSLNAGKQTVSLTNDTVYDAYVNLKKSWYVAATVQDAYDKRAESLKRYLPGAEMVKEKEALKLGTVDALSMTYRDPAQQKVHREVVFVHKGVPYELTFTVKEENFGKVKTEFGQILRGIEAF